MGQPEQFPEMIGVLDTEDSFALGMATIALSEAGIIYDVVNMPDSPANLESEKPKWWIPPSRILVSLEDADEARLLVEPFKSANEIPENDLDKSLIEKSQSERLSSLLWKGSPYARSIQRMGARLIGSTFIIAGLLFFSTGWRESTLFLGIPGVGFVCLGVWTFRHGLGPNRK
jgi:hypothetical protein